MTHFGEYLSALRREFANGDATEHTHRPALKDLIEALFPNTQATNEPKREKVGAPDFKIRRGEVPLGYIETKDLGINLAEIESGKGANGEQFNRYKVGLPNWILTNYLDFHWFVDGKRQHVASLGSISGGRISPAKDGEKEVAALLQAFLDQDNATVGTARELAQRMARTAHLIRDQIITALKREKDDGWLHTWLAAFQEVLVPDLDEAKFADMFAQTLCYGLFAARVHTIDTKTFTRTSASELLPKTNPFLKKLFYQISGPDMPESIE